jgi:uncharacterized protein YjbI with pentapeptide repeats
MGGFGGGGMRFSGANFGAARFGAGTFGGARMGGARFVGAPIGGRYGTNRGTSLYGGAGLARNAGIYYDGLAAEATTGIGAMVWVWALALSR